MGKVRCLCIMCKKEGKGGYFSVNEDEIIKALKGESIVKCPYCGSEKVKVLEREWLEKIASELSIKIETLFVNKIASK